MTALIALASDAGEPPSRSGLAAAFAALEEPPGDGDSTLIEGWVALGCRASWTTPEEVGERQPLRSLDGRLALLFDGRLDNREELLAVDPPAGGSGCSDAALALHRFVIRGIGALSELIGPWALVLVDLVAREVHLARDPLGGRPLCWARSGGRLRVASEPVAVLADRSVPSDIDDATVASLYAAREPRPDATFFSAVREVPAGSLVTFAAAGERRRRFWEPPRDLLRLASDGEYVEAFRERLRVAVRAQLRVLGPPAVLMSGGLDSTTVAALAAAAAGPGRRVAAVSWRFRELAGADESAYAGAMMEHAGLDAAWVEGDGRWTLRGCDVAAIDANAPIVSFSRRLHDGAYDTAAALGARSLLTGHWADELYQGARRLWLHDALRRGAWRTVWAGLAAHRRGGGDGGSGPAPRLRGALVRAVLGEAYDRLRPARRPPWLLPAAWELLAPDRSPLPVRRDRQGIAVLAPLAGAWLAAEGRQARRARVELRLPFRDQRVVELALRLPADVLARPGQGKYLGWRVGEGLLPEAVRQRDRFSNLGPLFLRGMEREAAVVRDLLLSPGPKLWHRFIAPEAIAQALRHPLGGEGVPGWVLWDCVAGELWNRKLGLAAADPRDACVT